MTDSAISTPAPLVTCEALEAFTQRLVERYHRQGPGDLPP